eukprot:jgi/Chrzof1/11415/Cz05g35250.t1
MADRRGRRARGHERGHSLTPGRYGGLDRDRSADRSRSRSRSPDSSPSRSRSPYHRALSPAYYDYNYHPYGFEPGELYGPLSEDPYRRMWGAG